MSSTLESHLTAEQAREGLARAVRAGLTAAPKRLRSAAFHGPRGGELSDRITAPPEYYPARGERSLLHRCAGELATVSGATSLVELGSGTSEKTRVLLSALDEAGMLRRYVPVDVDATVLTSAGTDIAAAYPRVDVRAVVAGLHAPAGRTAARRAAQGRLLGLHHRHLRVGRPCRLPGTDPGRTRGRRDVPARLIAAYDDASGVTAEFNRNVLTVINRELDADVDLAAFDHVAVWDAERARIELRLRARSAQRVRVGGLDLGVDVAAGEEMCTGISATFTRERVEKELVAAGLGLLRWWSNKDVALSLSTPV